MNHTQLLSRNQVEFSQLVQEFNELNSVYDNNFSLYLDSKGWELFDMRVGKTIFHYSFGQFKRFLDDIKKLRHDIVNVGCANIRCNLLKLPRQTEIWSVKAILKIYSLDDIYFFKSNLKKYLTHGFKQKKQNLADCY